MQIENKRELIPWPSGNLSQNFIFEATASGGNFKLHFKWLNNRWNLWVTLPSGEIRQAGVQPGVISWSEFDDYGIVFETDMETVDYNSLFLTELCLITWL